MNRPGLAAGMILMLALAARGQMSPEDAMQRLLEKQEEHAAATRPQSTDEKIGEVEQDNERLRGEIDSLTTEIKDLRERWADLRSARQDAATREAGTATYASVVDMFNAIPMSQRPAPGASWDTYFVTSPNIRAGLAVRWCNENLVGATFDGVVAIDKHKLTIITLRRSNVAMMVFRETRTGVGATVYGAVNMTFKNDDDIERINRADDGANITVTGTVHIVTVGSAGAFNGTTNAAAQMTVELTDCRIK